MDPSDWTTKEVLLWAGSSRLPAAISTYIQSYDVDGETLLQVNSERLMVAGLTSEDMEALLRAVERLKSCGVSAEVGQAVEASREAPPVLSRGNSKDSQSKKGKIKTFFSNLFGHKQAEPPKMHHAASIEILVDQFASDSANLLLPQHDMHSLGLTSPIWSEVLTKYRQFGCEQLTTIPRFSDLRSQWHLRETISASQSPTLPTP